MHKPYQNPMMGKGERIPCDICGATNHWPKNCPKGKGKGKGKDGKGIGNYWENFLAYHVVEHHRVESCNCHVANDLASQPDVNGNGGETGSNFDFHSLDSNSEPDCDLVSCSSSEPDGDLISCSSSEPGQLHDDEVPKGHNEEGHCGLEFHLGTSAESPEVTKPRWALGGLTLRDSKSMDLPVASRPQMHYGGQTKEQVIAINHAPSSSVWHGGASDSSQTFGNTTFIISNPQVNHLVSLNDEMLDSFDDTWHHAKWHTTQLEEEPIIDFACNKQDCHHLLAFPVGASGKAWGDPWEQALGSRNKKKSQPPQQQEEKEGSAWKTWIKIHDRNSKQQSGTAI